jgi:hypothetical protein
MSIWKTDATVNHKDLHNTSVKEKTTVVVDFWFTTTTFVGQTILENLGTKDTIGKREKLYSWRLEIGFGE